MTINITQVILQDPFVEWHCHQDEAKGLTVYTRGYTYIDDRLYEGRDLTTFIAQQCTGDAGQSQTIFDDLIPQLDVGWALAVVWQDGSVFAATDRVRSIPLLYSTAGNCLILAARIEDILKQNNYQELDSASALEFITFGYVTVDRTLRQNIQQMQPGEILKFNSNPAQLSLHRYFLYLPTATSDHSFDHLQDELEAIFQRCFHRLASQLNGEPIFIPLSGGLDSRLVAAMLKKVGYDNVICFSYGRYGNAESKISEAVAQSLGYRWEYVEYTPQMWQKWLQREQMKSFWHYCANGISLPSIKQLPAATTVLARFNLTPEDQYLFFPGYCLDFPAGSLVTYAIDNQRSLEDNLVGEVLKINSHLPNSKLNSVAPELYQELANRIKITGIADGHPVAAIAAYEKWICENRIIRFAVNTLRIHDYLGARWRTLWDNPITDFFLRTPLKYRYGKKIYASVLQERIFTESAAKLATIPLAKVGTWRGRNGIGLASRKQLLGRAVMKQIGVLNQYYKYKQLSVKKKKSDLNETYWFTDGIDPQQVELKTVWSQNAVFKDLPEELHPLLEEFEQLKVNQVNPFFLLSAISLAGIIKR
ncbi:MAG: asparagine synthase-related protein [Cyanobacteria bacterium P01_E01_bin.35]